MVSQSGNVAVNALSARRGIGWHTLVSTGNQAVCEASDWVEAVVELTGVRSVALFAESDGDGARLARALAAAADRGVGVAVLKVGVVRRGRAGGGRAHRGAGRRPSGLPRARRGGRRGVGRRPARATGAGTVLAAPRGPAQRGAAALAVLTCSGGDSGIAADQAELLGVELPAFAPATQERLDELLPPTATVANPLDWTAMIWDQTERLEEIVATVGDDPAIDQLLLLYDQPPELPDVTAASWAAVRDALVAGAEHGLTPAPSWPPPSRI